MIFEGDSRCYCEPETAVNLPDGTSVESTDRTRVSFIGSGRVTFKENAQFVIPRGALVGIESVGNGFTNFYRAYTNQSWALTDNAQFSIGSAAEYGGGFQIGNVFENLDDPNPLIDFTLILTGAGALLDLNSQGFLGLGVGIVNKPQSAPNTWLVGQLFDVNSVTLSIPEGTFQHNQIYSGDNKLAGLLAIKSSQDALTPPFYSVSFDEINADILGGGNMVLLSYLATDTNVVPLVQSVAGLTNEFIVADIISSKAALLDYPKFVQAPLVNVTGLELFNYLSMAEYTTQAGKTATIFRNALGEATIGFVLNNTGIDTIRRDPAGPIRGLNGTYVNPNNSLAIGAVGIAVDVSTGGAAELSQLNPEQ